MQEQMQEHIFSVSEYIDFLNEYLKPTHSLVQGEVGEKISKYPNYTFFNLIDTKDKSSIQCFAVSSVLRGIGEDLSPGMEIRVEGRASLFKKNGGLNIQVSRIIPVGEGALKKQFELLSKRLREEGYFDEERKKRIPRFTSAIGLITSSVGRGAKKDFLTHLGDFGFRIVLYPSKVEGSFAVNDLVSGISYLNKEYPMLQAIVITRGGGSWESLQAFNSEELVKAVAASNIPIISAIGHEDDVTLVDYVADIRASTPTHAARLLSEPWARASENIVQMEGFLFSIMKKKIQYVQDMFVRLERFIPQKIAEQIRVAMNGMTRPILFASGKMEGMKKHIQHKEEIISIYAKRIISNITMRLDSQEKTFLLASPTLKLKQGYSIVRNENGGVIREVGHLQKGDLLNIQFAKGSIDTSVIELHNDREKI